MRQRTAWASACPTPTERAKLVRIKGELEAAIAIGLVLMWPGQTMVGPLFAPLVNLMSEKA